ncbi:MAG: phage portal protein [Syntrophobacteraceae bacterium]
MLIELNRRQRIDKIHELATSKENQLFSQYFDYYNGDHFVKSAPFSAGRSFREQFNVYTRSGVPVFDGASIGDKVLVQKNWCRLFIDTIADYARGVNEDIVVTSDIAQDELQAIWKKNKINTLIKETGQESGKLGRTVLKLRRRKPGYPVELFQVDPGGVRFIKNPLTGDNEGAVYHFAIDLEDAKRLFPGVEMSARTGNDQVYYAEEWTIGQVFKFIDGEPVNEINENGLTKDRNPYGFIPFYEVLSGQEGVSDIADVIRLNDEYNMVMTFNHESLKYHGFPMYAPKGNFNLESVLLPEQLKDVEISPRVIQPFPMERIEAEGVNDSIIKYMQELRQDLCSSASVPFKLITAELDGNLSGVALQRLMAPLIKKAEDRRNYIREVCKQINRDMLSLMGVTTEADTDIIFPDIIKIDTNERLDEGIKKQTLGISKQTIFEELGYDYEDEDAKVEEEWDKSLDKRLIDEEQAANDKSGIQQNPKQIPQKGTPANQRKAA